MLEPLFGSGGPMWTTVPPTTGFAFQTPIGIGNGPIATPIFGSSNVPGLAGGVPAGTQPFPVSAGVPANAYGYGAGLIAVSPQSFSGLNLPGASPFTRNLSSFVGPDPVVGVTAPSLLAAVAMRRGQPQGPTNDQEVEDFIYDALELLPGAADVEVGCEGGRVTLTGSVQHKRIKRDVGEIAWAIPALHDVQNNVTIAPRRRTRSAAREGEGSTSVAGRKHG
jgi:hypothetical protein